MSLKAVFNNIIVKPLDEEETTYGSIVVPDLGKEKALIGTIISVGEGYFSVTGTFINPTLKEGQKVYLPAMGPTKIDFEGQEYWCCQENQVLAVLN